MTSKRIRCGCGRVYDPVKRPACPDCGATNVVVAAPEPAPEKRPEPPRKPSGSTPPPAPSPVSINPRPIAIGAAVFVVLVLVIALSRCGGEKKVAVVKDGSPTVPPSATPSATASASASVAVIPPPEENKPSPAARSAPLEENDLASEIANAAPGAKIKVRPGTYPSLVITRPVQLVGDANSQVFIKGEGKEALVVKSTGVSVQNIQFIGHGIGALPAVSVTAGAELQLEACSVQSNTAIGLLATGKASIKILGTTFAVPNGAGLRVVEQTKASLTQCSVSDTKIGLNVMSGSSAELHSCALERDGGNNGGGSALAVTGEGSAVTADYCHFNSNTAGLLVTQQASLTITKSWFENNAAGVEGGVVGLISLRTGARATLASNSFESNRQGVAVTDGGSVEILQCKFAGNGLQARQVVPASLPLLVSGEKSRATVRQSNFTDSVHYAIGVMAGGQLTLEDADISGSRVAAVILGERDTAPVRAVIRRSHLNNNGTGLGLLAGSSAELEDCEFRENNDGIIAFDPGTQLKASRIALVSNRERGLYVYSGAAAHLLDSDLKNNARGAISGTRGRASERASITLENCRLGGNKVFGAGAAAQSELILTNCLFDGTDKTNIYKERGANVQTNEPPAPAPSPTPPGTPENSPAPEQSAAPSVSPSPSMSPSPAPERDKGTPKPRRKPTPRPHPPTPEDLRRALRRLLPGG